MYQKSKSKKIKKLKFKRVRKTYLSGFNKQILQGNQKYFFEIVLIVHRRKIFED